MWQTEGQTDRQTDGRTELWWLRRTTAVAAVARKKPPSHCTVYARSCLQLGLTAWVGRCHEGEHLQRYKHMLVLSQIVSYGSTHSTHHKVRLWLAFSSWMSRHFMLCCSWSGVNIACRLYLRLGVTIEDYIRRENSRKISKHFCYLPWKSISTKIATVYFFLFSVNTVNYYCVILSLIQHDFIVYNRPP